ncbi:MAG: hypothetical protein OHK0047_16970 [Leptolyngbyaceae cyanobacterium]
MQIVWTKHAEERLEQWQERLKITREEVEAVVTAPQQTILEEDIWVAQVQRGNGLLRGSYVDIGTTRRILTLYWTNQVKQYWQEEPNEN